MLKNKPSNSTLNSEFPNGWKIGDTCVMITNKKNKYTQEYKVKGFDGYYFILQDKRGGIHHASPLRMFKNRFEALIGLHPNNAFSQEAIDLIKQAPNKLINDPCVDCSLNYDGSCCGCPKSRKYQSVLNEYRKMGVKTLKAAQAYKQYCDMKKECQKAENKLKELGLF